MERHERWVNLLKEKSPELAGDFQEYMDWLAASSGSDQEGIYLFGVRDGIRTAHEMQI